MYTFYRGQTVGIFSDTGAFLSYGKFISVKNGSAILSVKSDRYGKIRIMVNLNNISPA